MAFGKKQLEFLENKNYLNGLSLEARIEEIGKRIEEYEHLYSEGLAERIKGYIREQILSPSTPQWANFGIAINKTGTTALPVSCYIVSPGNSIADIFYAQGEVAMMSKLGGGVGVDFTRIADGGTYIPEDDIHTNPKLNWVENAVDTASKVSQGATRRGFAVPFVTLDEPEFDELMRRIKKTNDDPNDPLVGNTVGIILPEGWRQRIKDGDKELKRRYLYVLNQRMSQGDAYLVDLENCNKNTSPVYTKLGHKVSATNICTEALTPTYDDKSYSCVLSSLNLVHWDTIKANPQIIKDAMMWLDINVSEFIRLSEGVTFLDKSRRSAIEKRDVGLGTLGYHEYLQNKNITFGDIQSRIINKEIFSTIHKYCLEYAEEIGEKLGSPAMCQEAGLVRRNVSLQMIAPNKSTAFICGETSNGIEPFLSNHFVKVLAGIQTVFKNKGLKKLLIAKGKDTPEIWDSILDNQGSCQHLDFLTYDEKAPYKTAYEISPKDMITAQGDRQPFIDQAASLNLFLRANYTLQDVSRIHAYAWDQGIKTVYYAFSAHAANEKEGDAWDSCESCQD